MLVFIYTLIKHILIMRVLKTAKMNATLFFFRLRVAFTTHTILEVKKLYSITYSNLYNFTICKHLTNMMEKGILYFGLVMEGSTANKFSQTQSYYPQGSNE